MRQINVATTGLLLATALWAAAPSIGSAADFRAADTITIASGETLRDSLYAAAGNSVTIDGTVDGDVFAAAQTVILRGRITGSLFAAAQRIHIAGSVDGNVRTAAQTLIVEQRVAGDLIALGQTISLDVRGSVGRDAVLLGQEINLDGSVERSVQGAGQDVRVNGPIGGRVELSPVENLVLGPRANIGGDITYESTRELGREPGAQIGGRTTRREPPPQRHPEPAERLGGILSGILAVTVFGAGALVLAPRSTSAAASAAVHQSLLSLGWGFGLLVAIPLVAGTLLITIIGIPLALILIAAYAVLLYASQAIVALGVGRLLLSQLHPVAGYGWSVVAVLVGALIVGALRSVPVVDAVATLAVMLLGLGGMFIAYLEARKATSGVSPTPPPAEPLRSSG